MSKKEQKSRSLVRFLTVILTVVVVGSMGSVAAIRLYQVTLQTQTAAINQRRESILNFIGVLDTSRQETISAINTVAHLPMVQEMLLTGYEGHSDELEEILAIIFNVMNRDSAGDLYENILVFNDNFEIIAAANWEGDIPDMALFTTNIANAIVGLSHASPVVQNPVSGLVQVLRTQPIMHNGIFYGMVATMTNVENLGFFIHPLVGNEYSYMTIADRVGTVFFSGRPDYVGRNLADVGFLIEEGYTPVGVLFPHTSAITGTETIAYIHIEPIGPDTTWTVINSLHADAAENLLWFVAVSLIPTTIGIIVAAIIMVVILQKNLKPLRVLAQKAQQVSKGNLDVQFESTKNDEIGEVFESFKVVVGSLKETIEEVERSSQAKSSFLAKMSHEIRTPLNVIIGMIELILRENLSETVKERAQAISTSGTHLLTVINDVLDFSKIESGKMEIVTLEYSFHSVINDVVNLINARLDNPNVKFIAYMERSIPNWMFGDEVRIRQVLLNILTNSIKYTEKGRITLDVDWERIDDDNLNLIMRISDTGIGIRPEDQRYLFEDFVQFDTEKNKSIEGTGLGLSITHGFVKLMGGEITLESTYGLGSIFTVTLPQKYKEDPNNQMLEGKAVIEGDGDDDGDNIDVHDNADVDDIIEVPDERIRIEKTSDVKKSETTISAPSARILVVDDAPANLLVAKGLFQLYTDQIDTCVSGIQAIALVQERDYDIVFMDQMMPEMDGIEAVKAIRSLDKGRDLTIIALTANAVAGAKEMFLENGFDDFLSKPIEIKRINRILEKWVSKEKQQKEPVEDLLKNADTKRNTGKIGFTSHGLEIEDVDVARGISNSGGNYDVYIAALKMFYKDSETKIKLLKKYLEENDMYLYTTYVHAAKSTLKNIGADGLSEMAKQLENAGRQHDTTYILANNQIFLDELEKLRARMAEQLSNLR
ncbi:MAG: ATP-binding protein [Defluviitaleaceae bacterium]|nr:ATP-binding protein [Defluviitaleaceae bacterium]